MLVAVPTVLRFALLAALLCHGVVRRPRPAPTVVLVGADGTCVVPDWGPARLALGPQTLLAPYWVRLAFGTGPQQRDIVLLADQLPAATWTQLRARLRRVRCR